MDLSKRRDSLQMSDSERSSLRGSYRALESRIRRRKFLFEGAEVLVSLGKAVSLIIVILSMVPLALSLFLGYSFNVVLTPSMAPAIPVDSIAVTAPYLGQELPVGTVFGYQATGGEKILHRVYEVAGTDDSISYVAKGDQNNTPDVADIEPEQIWGVGVNVLEGPLASFIGSYSWNGSWAAQTWNAAVAGDWSSFFALLPGISWGALLLLGFVILFWWFLPSLLVSLGNRLVRSDELERRRLERRLGLPESESKEPEEDSNPVI